ncbi:hypothetical protein CVV43_01705 [Candidatus Saccharibacteria bacterium HGW-Saccharibacteria-1]|jgi:small conductance mechanosensitive channel|nr:MAG: hypothetical protein CVV43_01705 [Candidatus Saccharibacteria bacterium HGW-Saccharibacteria-1]
MEINFSSISNNILVHIAIIILVAFLLHFFSDTIVSYFIKVLTRRQKDQTKTDAKKREATLTSIFSTVAKLFIWTVAIVAILDAINLNISSIAAGAGVVGIIVGLGAQTTIRDYLAGVFIILENQYRVGDVITLSGGSTGMTGTSGTVEDITLRITKLRGLDGTLNVVRNGEASIITNRTFKFANIVIDIGIDYKSDIDVVENIMNKVGQDMMKNEKFLHNIFEPISFLYIDDLSDSSIIVRAMGKVKPAEQWEVAGEYRRLLLKAFNEANVKIALPQVVVHKEN